MSIELVDYVLDSKLNKKGPKYFGPFLILLLTLCLPVMVAQG
ncbi:hypothetical protein ABIB50_002643 [Mucilaginibacter sp. UYCu711]